MPGQHIIVWAEKSVFRDSR